MKVDMQQAHRVEEKDILFWKQNFYEVQDISTIFAKDTDVFFELKMCGGFQNDESTVIRVHKAELVCVVRASGIRDALEYVNPYKNYRYCEWR